MEPQTMKKRPRGRNINILENEDLSINVGNTSNLRTILGELPKNTTRTQLSSSSSTSQTINDEDNDQQNRSKRIRKPAKFHSEWIVPLQKNGSFSSLSKSSSSENDHTTGKSDTGHNNNLTIPVSSTLTRTNVPKNNSTNIVTTTTSSTSTASLTRVSSPSDSTRKIYSSSSSSSSPTFAPITSFVTPPLSRKQSSQQQQQQQQQQQSSNTTNTTTSSNRPTFTDYVKELQNYRYFMDLLMDVQRLFIRNPSSSSSSSSNSFSVKNVPLFTGILLIIPNPFSSEWRRKFEKEFISTYPFDLYNYSDIIRDDYAHGIESNVYRKDLVCAKELPLREPSNIQKITGSEQIVNNNKITNVCAFRDNDTGSYVFLPENTSRSKIKRLLLNEYIIRNDQYLKGCDPAMKITDFQHYRFEDSGLRFRPSTLWKCYSDPPRKVFKFHRCCRGYTGLDESGLYRICQAKLRKPFYDNNILSLESHEEDSTESTSKMFFLPPQLWSKDNLKQLYQFNREREESCMVSSAYLSLIPDVSNYRRALILDILIGVHHIEKLHPETLYLAINLYDRYVSIQTSSRISVIIMNVALICLWIASKHEEEWQKELHIDRIVKYSRQALDKKGIKQLESEVLNTLQFRISVPTTYSFFTYYCTVFDIIEHSPIAVLTLYIIELCLVRDRFLKYKPSLLAAAALNMAIRTFYGQDAWESTKAKEIGYTEEDLSTLIYEIETIIFGYTPALGCTTIESFVLAPRSIIFKYTDLSRYRIAFQSIRPLLSEEEKEDEEI